MEIKIISQKDNKPLKRREITFEVEHAETGGTPARTEIRRMLASLLKVDQQLVYIKRLETRTGTRVASGNANAYDSLEQAKLIEPEYIIERNSPSEKKPKGEG